MATLARSRRYSLLLRHALSRRDCVTDSFPYMSNSLQSLNNSASCRDYGGDRIAALESTQLGFTAANGASSRFSGSLLRGGNIAVLRNQKHTKYSFPECGVRFYRGGGTGGGRTFHDFDKENEPGESKGPGRDSKDGIDGWARENVSFRRMMAFEEEEEVVEVPKSAHERLEYVRMRESEIMLSKFMTEVIDVNRTFKVTKGGGETSFTALVICGNGDGLAGWAKGKGPKATGAIREATVKALNNLQYFERFKDQTTYHYVEAKYEKTKVRLWPAWTLGKFKAGGIVSAILRMVGITSVKSKLIGSSNPHNAVKATFLALSKIKTPKEYEEKYWRAVVERHLILDDEGKPHPKYRKISSYVL